MTLEPTGGGGTVIDGDSGRPHAPKKPALKSQGGGATDRQLKMRKRERMMGIVSKKTYIGLVSILL